MSTAEDPEKCREAIRTTLARRAGGTTDPSAIADATVGTWNEVAAQLSPVIGVRGVEALFARALQLTSIAHPWLANARGEPPASTTLAEFKSRVERREPAGAMEACRLLLVTFTELLASLIGTSLTARLLGPVWTPSPPESQVGTKP